MPHGGLALGHRDHFMLTTLQELVRTAKGRLCGMDLDLGFVLKY